MYGRRGMDQTMLILSAIVTTCTSISSPRTSAFRRRHSSTKKTGEVFPGTPEIRKGYMYANDQPGFGIDIDEKAAAKYPYKTDFESRGNDRLLDGTIVRP
jgi:mannonate dehydratase